MGLAFKVAANSPRRRAKYGYSPPKESPKNPWEPWYAWYPRFIKGKWFWRTWVYRRHVLSPGGGFYEYGTEFDALKWK